MLTRNAVSITVISVIAIFSMAAAEPVFFEETGTAAHRSMPLDIIFNRDQIEEPELFLQSENSKFPVSIKDFQWFCSFSRINILDPVFYPLLFMIIFIYGFIDLKNCIRLKLRI